MVTLRARDGLADYGERLAARRLSEAGMVVLARRWRCVHGEIDIVAQDGDCLVVCEVKTRRSLNAGGPLEAVTPAKFARLRRLAAAWLASQDAHFPQVRIDVIGRPDTQLDEALFGLVFRFGRQGLYNQRPSHVGTGLSGGLLAHQCWQRQDRVSLPARGRRNRPHPAPGRYT